MAGMLDSQILASRQVQEIVDASEGSIECLSARLDDSGKYITFHVTLPFQGLTRAENGLPIRAREEFLLQVPPGFPFFPPSVYTLHRRFAGYPHVQWGYSICLHQSRADWSIEDGMYGLVERLDQWVRDAALGRLDPDDAPLHPPVAYRTGSARMVVPLANTPKPPDEPWFGFACLRERGARTEIISWSDERPDGPFAPAILLHEPFPFEYPGTVSELTREFERHGVNYGRLLWMLARMALNTPAGSPLLVVIGSPMRRVSPNGVRLQHLEVWEIDREAADSLRGMNGLLLSEEGFEAFGKACQGRAIDWSLSAKTSWCNVREMRPEVTRRRDEGSATGWFEGRRVAIWGCGAIGSKVAEYVLRAGASHVSLTDSDVVTPGVLVRQAFTDADIGKSKAVALQERLLGIFPDAGVQAFHRNLLYQLDEGPLGDVDIILDCTASSDVRTKLECVLIGAENRPLVASLAVSHNAQAALATLSFPGHSGGPLDLTRRLKVEACRRPNLSSLLDAFWPVVPRTERFQPEPGCSEPTFVGSDADLAVLSSRMLNAVAVQIISAQPGTTATGWLLEAQGKLHEFTWSPDVILGEENEGYSVRVSPEAVREIRAWAKASNRRAGPRTETGGLVFGEFSEAARVIWVTEVEGPPADSDASESHFTCGVAGMTEASAEKAKRYRGSVSCIGSWHTHPDSIAEPSDTDVGAVAQLLHGGHGSRRRCLLLIASGSPENLTLGAHGYRKEFQTDAVFAVSMNAASTVAVEAPSAGERDVGLALSGGGSRAIAFHLGCFRALHDLNLLERLQVVSSVSGGSVLAAMYAYTDEPFPDFERRVILLLRTGFAREILAALVKPKDLLKALSSFGKVGTTSLLRTAALLIPERIRPGALDGRTPPPRRTYSRSEAFRNALAKRLFGETRVCDVVRANLDVVLNATELRTGSAFRFGSRQSGCWRFGLISDDAATVADAVAASAAYPALLPALDRDYDFHRADGTSQRRRVALTDGGVFENLGVSPMEPGRSASVSTNVFRPDFIIACDAGAGLLDDDSFPSWWPSRMNRSFLTTFRKVQDGTRGRLHRFAESGELKGFVLSYLGQDDKKLPWIPEDLPKRKEVYRYPTDFSSMADEDIDRLTRRGEILTRLLVAHYLPHL